MATQDDGEDYVEKDPTGRYERFKEILGKGSSKKVYKAFDEEDGMEVAWCRVRLSDEILNSPKKLNKLVKEADLMKSLNHPNVVKCYNSWVDYERKTFNMITELFTSGDLGQYCRKHTSLSDNTAIKSWARQVLSGLKYLHGQNPPIAHRDLKCANVFLNGNSGKLKIGDLGLATILDHRVATSFLGTPEYMAPEMYDEEYDHLVDIYAFGMCVLQMDRPYRECQNRAQIFRKVSTGIMPADLNKVKDHELRLFIDKCLAPVSERLSAEDLLKEPFLAVSPNSPTKGLDKSVLELLSPRTVAPAPRADSVGVPVASAGAAEITTCQILPKSLPLLVDSAVTDHKARTPPAPVVVVKQIQSGFYIFQLIGIMEKTNTISMTLRVMNPVISRLDKIEFLFDMRTDVASSVAAEMVTELEFSDEQSSTTVKLMEDVIKELTV